MTAGLSDVEKHPKDTIVFDGNLTVKMFHSLLFTFLKAEKLHLFDQKCT